MARERATDTQALVSAAAKTFREKGYRSSTIDDIALAAGISRPTSTPAPSNTSSI
jgi:AcrR family transcriptional regulator